MEFISIYQLKKLSTQISRNLKSGDSIYLYGEIGTGKTSFARFLINILQNKSKKKIEEITSPTYNIVQYYKITNKTHIHHYDLYRIKKKKDLNNIGIYNDSIDCIKIIEWPELIRVKEKNRIEIYLKHTKKINIRKINVKYFGRFKN